MALELSGAMSMGGSTEGRSINLELLKQSNALISLNDDEVRGLANISSGNISLEDFYGAEIQEYYGEAEFTTPGTYSWECPENVTRVSVLVIGGGGGGDAGSDLVGVGGGGGGGALAFRNNITVVPGQTYTIVVGDGGFGQNTVSGTTVQVSTAGNASSAFSCIAGGGGKGTRSEGGIGIGSTQASGGIISGIYDSGQSGGTGGSIDTSAFGFRGPGGGGAAGYTGIGGAGARGVREEDSPATSAGFSGGNAAGGGGGGGGSGYTDDNVKETGGYGGGVGIYGEGTSGQGGAGGSSTTPAENGGDGSDGSNGLFGAGGGGGSGGANRSANNGKNGAVRIIWPGTIRQFPTSRTANIYV